jgi:anthranilate synthase component II
VSERKMILLIDNYDSFVFNLARYFERLGQETHVVRNDATDVATIERMEPQAVVLSPGPCSPKEAGCSVDAARILHTRIPILGVCLGHQAIGEALGGCVVRANEPMHGRASEIHHRGESIFSDLPNPLTACRYHSLVVERTSLPACLQVTAWTSDGTIMGLAHRNYPVVGVQFHPESILTEMGYPLVANFLRLSGITLPTTIPTICAERDEPLPLEPVLPLQPVTF